MTVLSLQEAVERTGTSKIDIWRAIQAGMLSAKKTDDGGFAIDPAALFAVFETKQADQCPMAEDAVSSPKASESPETSATPETATTIDIAAAFAALGTQKCLFEMPAEAAASDELRQNRDEKPAVELTERNAQLAEPAAERAKAERWPNMLRWGVNLTSPGGGGSSDGSGRAVAGQQNAAARKAVETTDAAWQQWSQESYGGGGKKLSFVLPSP